MNDLYNPPPSAPKRPIYRRKGFWVGVAALVVVGAIANGTKDTASSDAKPSPVVTVTTTPTPTESSLDDALDDIQASNSAARESLKAEISKAAKEDAAKIPDVPNVVGMNHAKAMTVLHTAGFMVDEEDASPEGRWIIANSNWRVCRQSPEPGTSGKSVLRVTIYSVKSNESC